MSDLKAEIVRYSERLSPLANDASMIKKYEDVFCALHAHEKMRAFLSRICFLEWVAIFTMKHRTPERTEAVYIALMNVTLAKRAFIREWSLEQFYGETLERELGTANLKIDANAPTGKRLPLKYLMRQAFAMRNEEYNSIAKAKEEKNAIFFIIGQSMLKQIMGERPSQDNLPLDVLAEYYRLLSEDWVAVKALEL